ncbi:MAG: sigma-70 family RNA polymerase sigma factor [Ruminococcaceae bacterium]|nr:sigma-70 family RNA polymerase sigma factor [Oscillospiraceae bacterium]
MPRGVMKAEMQNRDAAALVLRVRQGEQAAFSALLTMYEPLIAKRVGAFAVGLSHEDAQDLRQVALVAFYRAACGFDVAQSEVEFGLYAKICMDNAMVSHLRVLRRHEQTLPLLDAAGDAAAEDPAGRVMDEEATAVLLSRIRGVLSAYEYRVWTLYVAGHRTGEIAKRLQKPTHSIENAVYRIRQKLRAALGDLR